jgi:ATP-binding cassette subfamily F protein 3
VISYEGNYEDYLRKKEMLAATGNGSRVDDVHRGNSQAGSASTEQKSGPALYQGTTSVVPKSSPKTNGALAPAESSSSSNTFVIEGGFDSGPKEKARRLNPIKQKQMEERVAFLEEETPRIEASIAHTEEQLGNYVSAAETARLTALADDLRGQLASLTAEWEELMMQLEGA